MTNYHRGGIVHTCKTHSLMQVQSLGKSHLNILEKRCNLETKGATSPLSAIRRVGRSSTKNAFLSKLLPIPKLWSQKHFRKLQCNTEWMRSDGHETRPILHQRHHGKPKCPLPYVPYLRDQIQEQAALMNRSNMRSLLCIDF